jgi:hypothetical protein
MKRPEAEERCQKHTSYFNYSSKRGLTDFFEGDGQLAVFTG